MPIRIGTSGWVYNHWRGIFYPADLRQAGWLRYYVGHFDTVEINNSFYRLPSEAAFDAWREQAPPGFVYAVKASRYLTHFKKLKDPEPPLQLFFERAGRLGPALGPVLYQLPPHWPLNLPRFETFLAAVPAGHKHVVEFRDASWLVPETFRLLARYGVAHCIHDMRPLRIPEWITAKTVYLRFHGAAENGGHYSDEALAGWARRLDDWHRQDLDVYAYFNNDWNAFAVQNAQRLKELLAVPAGQA